MSKQSEKQFDLYGSAPDTHDVALLLIEVINHFEYPSGEALLQSALSVASNIARLKAKAQQENVSVFYINDNFGRWQSNFD